MSLASLPEVLADQQEVWNAHGAVQVGVAWDWVYDKPVTVVRPDPRLDSHAGVELVAGTRAQS